MNFKEYLETGIERTEVKTEAVITKFEKDELKTIQEILCIIKDHKGKLTYRGFSGMNQTIGTVSNKRSSFYGALRKEVHSFIKGPLGVKYPTFATTDETQAMMFGQTFIFVSKGTGYVHTYMRDILSDTTEDTNFEGMEKGFTKGDIDDVSKRAMGEIIVDTPEYYLINYKYLAGDFRSKFFKPKKEAKDWQDVYDLLYNILKYENWKIKNNKRDSFEVNQQKQKKMKLDRENAIINMYSKKQRDLRLKTIRQDTLKHKLPLIQSQKEINKVQHLHKSDGKSITLTFKYKKDPKVILKYYQDHEEKFSSENMTRFIRVQGYDLILV